MDLILKFRGIDDYNRPVFVDKENKNFYGSADRLFSGGETFENVIKQLEPSDLIFFGYKFNCEPKGGNIREDINIILIK